MEISIDINDFEKEEFLRFASNNSKIELGLAANQRSRGLSVATAEIITIVSSTVTIVELSRLLIAWLRNKSRDTVSIKSRDMNVEIMIKKDMSEQEIIELVRSLTDRNV